MFNYLKKFGHRNYWPYYLTFLVGVFTIAIFGKEIVVRGFFIHLAAGDNASRPQAIIGTPTIESIGVEIINAGDDNLNASFTLEYKKTGDSTWKLAYTPPRSYNRLIGTTNYTYYNGSLMFLSPGTAYDFRATVTDADGGSGTVKTGSATTRPDFVGGSTSRTLYVDPGGNDANLGTDPASPLKTIQHAANISQAGDRILVQSGTYNENIIISRSGTSNSPIIFESAQQATNPGANPAKIEGGEAELAVIDTKDNWLPDDHIPANAGVYYTTLDSWTAGADNPIYVAMANEKIYAYWYYPYNSSVQTFSNFINGLYCSSNCATGCCASNVSGGYWYDSSKKRLYIKLPNSDDPDSHVMHVVKRNSSGIKMTDVSNVVIRGFDIAFNHIGIHFFGTNVGSHDNTVEKNILHHNGSGVMLGENTANGAMVYGNLIQNNKIYDSKVSEWPWSSVKLNDVESDGITLFAGRSNIVRRNTINDVFNGIMMSIFWDLANVNFNKESDINDNNLYDIGDDAIEPEGANINLRIFNNKVYRVARATAAQSGISLAPVSIGPTWVVRNILSDIFQSALKYNVDIQTSIGQTLVFHNTVYNRTADFMALFRIWRTSFGLKAILRNNVFYSSGNESSGWGEGYVFEDINTSHSNPPITLDMDYDSLFTDRQSLCGQNCRFTVWTNTPYTTLALFKSASNQESHGQSLNPKLANPGANDFTPINGSPLIDSGVLLPGINDNFIGNGPDIGAIESTALPCIENWSCSDWSACANNTQSRTCTDLNNCGTTNNRPALTQACVVLCTPNWQCGDWSACVNNTQTKTCADSNNCGTTSGRPPLTQSCSAVTPPPPTQGIDNLDTGALLALQGVKGAAVYYIANNGKKYVFPDSKTYSTWYSDFNKVQRVSLTKLDTYANGGVMPYRAGTKLITHPDTSKIYAVEPGGVLRHVLTAALAGSLYGNNWMSQVQDVIPGFFSTSYLIGAPLDRTWPNGVLAKYNNNYFYLVANKKRKFTSISVLKLNRFDPNNAIALNNLDNYTDGYDIISLEKPLASFRPGVTEAELLGASPGSLGDLTDSDGDGLSNYEETKVWLTNPNNPDTDGDHYSDGLEIRSGYNPSGNGTIEAWINR